VAEEAEAGDVGRRLDRGAMRRRDRSPLVVVMPRTASAISAMVMASFLSAVVKVAVPSGLVRMSSSPARRRSLRKMRSGWTSPTTARP